MMINKIIDRFFQLIEVSRHWKIVVADLDLIAIKELQIALSQISDNDFVKSYNALDESLQLLKNRRYIFDYEKIDHGFKIIPKDKIYIDENDLIVKFNTD